LLKPSGNLYYIYKVRFFAVILSIVLALIVTENCVAQKRGAISALWYDIEPFIYRTNQTSTGMAAWSMS